MISVASLLNPDISEPRSTQHSSSPCLSYSTTSSTHGSPLILRDVLQKQKMTKDGAVFAKSKVKGNVNFPPFEELDEEALREAERYQVQPLGKIERYPRHIPYNSEKKSFLDKTGRESFEVFQYEFKVPGDDKTYTVMWDYNVGLVRITPFFKCCKYSKTTPAKMLNMNPGLKDITHSITGGALAAQGYWMPYSCARGVCATFCAHISGALIPIFGPAFPSKCIPTSHADYGRMTIDPSIITSATAEAESFRQQYFTSSPAPSITMLESPGPIDLLQDVEYLALNHDPNLDKRKRLKRTFTNSSLYNTDADTSDTSASYPCSPLTPESYTSATNGAWKAANAFHTLTFTASRPRTDLPSLLKESMKGCEPEHRSTVSCGVSPYLSAIPRSIASGDGLGLEETLVAGRRKGKRRVVELDEEYDGEESANESEQSEASTGNGGMEKKAAWALMNLSVRDGDWSAGSSASVGGGNIQENNTLREQDGRMVKRIRATLI